MANICDRLKLFCANHNRCLFWLITCFIGAITTALYYPDPLAIGHDMSSYMVAAKNFADGNGMVDPSGAPSLHRLGYKLLLASAFKLGGTQDLWMISTLQAIFFGVFCSGLYAIGQRLYGYSAGIGAALLFCAMPQIDYFIPSKGLDIIWPAILLWSFYALIQFVPEKITSKAILWSGCLWVSSFWMKEMGALFFLPVPLILFLFHYIQVTKKQLALFYALCAVGIILNICVHHVFVGLAVSPPHDVTSELQTLKTSFGTASHMYGDSAFISLVLFFLIGVLAYFLSTDVLIQDPIYVFALIVLITTSLWLVFKDITKGNCRNISSIGSIQPYRIMRVVFMCYLPFIAWAGQWMMRFEEILFIVGLSFVLFSAVLKDVVDRISCSKSLHMIIYGLLIVSVSASIYWHQYDRFNQSRLGARYYVSLYQTGYNYMFKGAELKKFISSNLKPDESVMVTSLIEWNGLGWALGQNHKVYLGPYTVKTMGLHASPYMQEADMGKTYDVMTLSYIRKATRFPQVHMFNKQDFIESIKAHKIRFIVIFIDENEAPFIKWLKSHGIKNVAPLEFRENTGQQIFIGDLNTLSSHVSDQQSCYVGAGLIDRINQLENTFPYIYSTYKYDIVQRGMGLSNADIERLFADGVCP